MSKLALKKLFSPTNGLAISTWKMRKCSPDILLGKSLFYITEEKKMRKRQVQLRLGQSDNSSAPRHSCSRTTFPACAAQRDYLTTTANVKS